MHINLQMILKKNAFPCNYTFTLMHRRGIEKLSDKTLYIMNNIYKQPRAFFF